MEQESLIQITKKNILLQKRIKELEKQKDFSYRLECIEQSILELILLIKNKKQATTKKGKINSVSKKLREEILKRDNFTCKNCGYNDFIKDNSSMIPKLNPDHRDLHIDHIIPRSKGGTNNPKNLQVLCSSCNLIKKAYVFDKQKGEQQ